MNALGAAHLYLAYRRLRLTGTPAAARTLIDALGSPDENLRTLGGMFLVRAGRRSVPALMDATAARHQELATVLLILADIGGEDAKATLERFADDPEPAVAHAAEEGLATIAMSKKLGRSESPFTD